MKPERYNEVLDNKALEAIAKVFGVPESEIIDIAPLKAGMNYSFSFSCEGLRYIMRIPSEGGNILVNREHEYAAYRAIAPYEICDNPIYLETQEGYKIVRYIENSRTCDPLNLSEVKACMDKLKELHDRKLVVEHVFDIFEMIKYYESLWSESSYFRDYETTRDNILSLKEYIDSLDTEWCLTHLDANQDNFLGNDMGLYYLAIGVIAFGTTMYIAFSRFGKIRLGNMEKPKYSTFTWGTMIFTSTMAADILFHALIEWSLYASEPYMVQLGDIQLWSSTYPLFHWGPIGWSLYIILAVAFGFMLHVRLRTKQKISEACRPLFGEKVDGILGKVIDIFVIFSLIAGTATTFSLATPLLSSAIAHVFGFGETVGLTISILVIIALIYTIAVLLGMNGISKLANFGIFIFAALLFYFLFLGGETRFILETGFSAIGNLAQNFIGLATRTDPLRETTFTQDWTVFFWAFWMSWSVGTSFFHGIISKGRTIKNTIFGIYCWGIAGTFTTFILLGNYGLAQQMRHGLDTIGTIYNADYSINTSAIIAIFETLPLPALALIILAINMILFYATTFDALTMVIASYSHKKLMPGDEPKKGVSAFWAILFILFPIALIFNESSLYSLQSVSIIAVFPIGIIITIIVISFFKDARKFLDKR